MKIELKGPYALLWRSGYLTEDGKGRKLLLLHNDRKNKTTISYAKYLMVVKLNRLLEPDELVEHEDNDKTNDTLTNLKLTTKSKLSSKVNKTRMWTHLMERACNGNPIRSSTLSGVQ